MRSVDNPNNLLWERSRAHNTAIIYSEIAGDYLSCADVIQILRASPDHQE